MFYRKNIKHVLDFLMALLSVIILSPFLIIIALLVRVNIGSPILFKQARPGLNEKIFMMIKFRTMTNERDKDFNLLPDSLRLTKFGKFLRSASIDELPSLINVLKGEMSIVGPRPLAVQYLPYYNEIEKKRHTVFPGITGLAQVNGRNSLDWERKFQYDIEYINKMCFSLDFLILFRTIFKVLKRSEIGLRGVEGPEDFDKYRQAQNKIKIK